MNTATSTCGCPAPATRLVWRPCGKAESRWERDSEAVAYSITVPANCTAEIKLPDGSTRSVTAGEHQFKI